MRPSTRYTVFLVDDHPAVLESYRRLLAREPDLCVCGQANSGAAALEFIDCESPAVVLMDYGLPDMDGADLVRRVRARHPNVGILVVSGRDAIVFGRLSLEAGATGFVRKRDSAFVLPQAIRCAARGERFVDDELRAYLSPAHDRPAQA